MTVPSGSAALAAPAPATLSPRLTLAMAVAAGTAAANVWYSQPMLGVIGREFGAGAAQMALIPTATQIGYALGIVLLLPLGDRMDRRALILRQFVALIAAQLAAAAAPGAATLIAASTAIGISACIAQQIVPFVADLAEPARRGRAVGAVMTGLLAGILLGRVLSGVVAAHAGWRALYVLAAAISVGVAGILAVVLPHSRPAARGTPYAALLLSGVALWRQWPALRRAALVQAGLFAGFSAFWSVLALKLQAPPLFLGSEWAGLFGVLGAAGVMVASVAGRMADRYGPRRVVGAGILLTASSFVVFAIFPTLGGLIGGLILLDLGVQGAQIGNQSVIYALVPEARGRVNSIFMTTMFVGGAIGSYAAGLGWVLAGWGAVCAVGLALAAASLAAYGRGRVG
jgi:predicted MFS family arabinose efflux permease